MYKYTNETTTEYANQRALIHSSSRKNCLRQFLNETEHERHLLVLRPKFPSSPLTRPAIMLFSHLFPSCLWINASSERFFFLRSPYFVSPIDHFDAVPPFVDVRYNSSLSLSPSISPRQTSCLKRLMESIQQNSNSPLC